MLAYAPRPRQRLSPSSLTIIIGLHGAAIAAFLLSQPGLILVPRDPPIEIENIPIPKPPPPEPTVVEPREPAVPLPPTPERPTLPDPIVDVPVMTGVVSPPWIDPTIGVDPLPAPPTGTVGGSLGETGSAVPAPTAPRLLTSGADLQPPYPASKRRGDEEALLRLRLVIGADGRVTSVFAIGDADRAFVRAAERHIKRVWRYAPATRSGNPIEGSTTVTMRFVLE